jgi:hypothetical protein
MNLEENLSQLLEELRSGIYKPGRSICFVVTEPSPREIFAADFRDRIVHHLFVREIMAEAENRFIYDSYACRFGKGTHKAVSRLRLFAKKVSADFKSEAWYMKIDLKSFFMSIDHNLLYRFTVDLIEKHRKSDEWKKEMANLAEIIVYHKPGENYIRKGDPELAKLIPPHKSLLKQKENKGLPIGNYSSQFFANLYLNKLDHFIKSELKCQYYLRYVDDLVLLSKNKEQLKIYLSAIQNFMGKNLSTLINGRKTIIQPIKNGMDFLGYFVKSERIYTRRKVWKRYKNKLFQAAVGNFEIHWKKLMSIAASYRGHSGYFC